MDCTHMLSKRKRYHFEAIVRLHSLVAVPYVNAVTFAKLRLLDTRHSSQYSPRVEIRNHSVTWNTEHRFICKFRSNMGTNVLEPKILKISIRMETKGGKSFYKVGFVSVNLACFTAMGNATSRRRYILEGYDEKHKRQDNSLLLVSFSMRQLFGDTCFRIPPENLSNCLVEPPDSDEGETLIAPENTDGSERKLLSAGPVGSLLGSDIVTAANGQASSSPFERRLHALNMDPLVTTTERYASQPARSNSTVSTCFTCIPHLVHPNASGTNLFSSTMTTASEGLPSVFPSVQRDHPTLPPDELASLLNKLFPPSSSEQPLDDPELQNITITNPTDTQLPMGGDITVQCDSNELPNLAPLSIHSRRSTSCPAAHQSHVGSGSRLTDTVEAGDHNPDSASSPSGVDTGGTASRRLTGQHSSFEEASQRTGCTEAILMNNFSSSSSVTPTSFSSTPGSTATGSPVARMNPSTAPNNKCALPNPNTDLTSDHSTSLEPNPAPLGLYDNAFDQDAACRSLPLPPHYSACRRRCDLRVGAISSVTDPLRHKPSEYFATDTGLLLPSRRRKSRPLADFAFPPSQMRVCPAFESRDISNLDRDLDETVDMDAGDTTTGTQTGLSLTSYRSTGLESHSSGYQSHSRQSSLESQTVTGSMCALALGHTTLSVTTTVSALPPHSPTPGLLWHSRINLPSEETPAAPR